MRTSFNELRRRLSPEAQARVAARTAELLAAIPSEHNIFADLGFPGSEAARLLAESEEVMGAQKLPPFFDLSPEERAFISARTAEAISNLAQNPPK